MESAAKDFSSFVHDKAAWLASLIEAIPDGIVITDTAGMILLVNQGYVSLTGRSAPELIGESLVKIRPGSLLPQSMMDKIPRYGTYRCEGDTKYIVDVGPILIHGEVAGGVGVAKSFEQVKKISQELEKHIRKTMELKTAVNRAYRARYTFGDLIGTSLEFHKTINFAQSIARYDTDILITGESGTGKEVFAQAIHNASSRADMPFIAINCSTLNTSLVESELFGYDKGTFTGALKEGKAGLFTVADGGTIMLDEIGDLPYDMQAKLLRVLQERCVRRMGDASEEPVDIRVIAATNRDLRKLIEQGTFREDLFYRLNAVTLRLPSLRHRKEDLRALADHFLTKWCQKQGKYLILNSGVYEQMLSYDWPGNIRELRNVIDLAAYTCEGKIITELPMPSGIARSFPEYGLYQGDQIGLKEMLDHTERGIIKAMLVKYGDSVEAKKIIAARLQISLATLYNKIKNLTNNI